MHHRIDGEPFTMLFELGDPFGKLVDVGLRLLKQVPFDAHVPKNAMAMRNSCEVARCVECAGEAPTCSPIISGGTSSEV